MTKTPSSKKAEIVAAKDYPAMLDEKAATEFLRMMARSDTAKRMNNAVEVRRGEISGAVRGYVQQLAVAASGGDLKTLFKLAHEIRGLAGTGGLEATGKIADGLCKYIDTASQLDATPESSIIALHIDAIARASSKNAEAKTYGERVATELGMLVARKLQAINELKTKSAAAR
jgi:Hpt domain